MRILEDRKDGRAAFYCSASDWAFGPLMQDVDEAKKFLAWLKVNGYGDPRDHGDGKLESLYSLFRQEITE